MSKAKSIVALIVSLILTAIVGVACFASFPVPFTHKTKQYNSIMSLIGKGIDLSGGYYVVLTPKDSSDSDANKSEYISTLESAQNILRSRLDSKGYTEATISVQDGNKIRVEIPEVDNAEEVLQVIGSTGEISFRNSAGDILVKAEHIKSAYVSRDPDNASKYVVVLNFTAAGTEAFSKATKEVYESDDKTLYIYLGDEVVSSPSVSGQLTESSATITGYETYDEADAVASVIESGRLPIDFEVSESRSISARLGEDAINKSLLAGVIGMAIIFIIMIVVYGGMGIAADIALFIYTLLYIIFMAIVPGVQLTLPGIAGILLSIGMAVDANIVIYERIKEEYRNGKTVLASVDSGFKRAVITVIDSNVTTILSAAVLYFLCPGTIKGFAITLFIGIVLSMITSIFVTRWYLKIMLSLSEKKEKFFRLKREETKNA
ncbi:MAG TPA: protein translocase subunit SecD [Clostridiales bacterium]|nr:protein translocase subunit SecD [Clostridiales bacterium]